MIETNKKQGWIRSHSIYQVIAMKEKDGEPYGSSWLRLSQQEVKQALPSKCYVFEVKKRSETQSMGVYNK